MPPDDFFNEDWEEPSRTKDTAAGRPTGEVTAGTPRRRSERPERPERPGGRRPRRPPGRGSGTPEWRRLAVLGAAILIVIAVVAFLATEFFGGGGNATAAYFRKLEPALTRSDQAGIELRAVLDSPPMTAATFQHRLQPITADALAAYQQARSIKPSSAVAAYAPFMVEALRYRYLALLCLARNAPAAFRQTGTVASGAKVTTCTQLMLASDQLYLNSFYTQAVDARTGQAVPTSRFLGSGDARWVTALGAGQAIERLRPQAVHGLHGMQLLSVVANPGGHVLSPTAINRVTANSQLRFVVTAVDGGRFEEVRIPVTLRLTVAGQKPITSTRTIASVIPGGRAVVVFGNLFSSSNPTQYVKPYTLSVTVHPVPGERNLSNNSASYRVSFVIG